MNAKHPVPGQTPEAMNAPASKPAKPSKVVSFNRALAQNDLDARRKAAAILEVLAGARKPSDAAKALGITTVRYYMLEMRAIQGLVKACEPPKLGPKGSPDREAQGLRKQVQRMERECARYAALARVAQRAVNLSPPPATGASSPGKKGRRRKPHVRAVKMLARIQSGIQESAPGDAHQASAPVAGSPP